jgi:hypothetical protein
MRNNVIRLLKNEDNKRDKVLYNELLKIYTSQAGVRQVYHYQLGYTPQKLENLVYDMKNLFFISDKDIAVFKETEQELLSDDKKNLEKDLVQGKTNLQEDNELIAAQKKAEQTIEALRLKDNPDVLEGLKFRDEYPFLNEENTPMEIKALVTDKITAYKNYAAAHGKILIAESDQDAEDKLYELAKSTLAHYEVNQDVKKELDFYRDSNGRILGEHPSLEYLRVKQDVFDMTEADLVKGRGNAQKNISRYETQGKTELLAKWKYRLGLIEERLVKEFNHKFDKK